MTVNDDLPGLLALLACPSCQGELAADSDGLRCTRCGRAYARREGVPALVGGEARERATLGARLQYAFLGNPRLYDLHQALGGGREIADHVRRELRDIGARTLLDVGAGTGMVSSLIEPGTRYVWLDNDVLKLRGFLSKGVGSYAVLADAARLPLRDRAADWTVMIEVSHHLPDAALRSCLDEAARVTRDRFLFVDALRGERLRSRALWKLDLGRFPRTEAELVRSLDASFEVERVKRFRVNHDHLLCVCAPRPRATGADDS